MFRGKKKQPVPDPHEFDCIVPLPAAQKIITGMDINFRNAMANLHTKAGRYREMHSSGYIDEVARVTGSHAAPKQPLIHPAVIEKIGNLKPTVVLGALRNYVLDLMGPPKQTNLRPISPPPLRGLRPTNPVQGLDS